jgi:ParB family chromosome partitioning protein
MSLVENLARCRPSNMDLVREIETLRGRGYTQAQIAAKIGVTESYVSQLVRLVENGEERLIAAVERGEIPIVAAMDIAAADDAGVQQALAEAYTTGKLRGKGLVAARRLVELRRMHGKGRRLPQGRGRGKVKVSTDDIVRTYRRQTQRQQLLVKKARVCETRLVFIAGALKQLCADDAFVKLLRAESLDTIPEYLADSIRRSSR